MLRSLRELYLDSVHRRPSGWIGRLQYGGARGAPKDHEADFVRALEWLGPVRGERCLEIGCGGGAMLERVLAAGATHAAAVDHSPDMIALAAARNREGMRRGVLALELGDACRIPWPEASFEAACALNMFFFVERPRAMLAEIARVLVPGGRVVIKTLAGPLPRSLWLSLWRFGLHAYTEAEMADLYADAGFGEVRIETVAQHQWSRAVRS